MAGNPCESMVDGNSKFQEFDEIYPSISEVLVG